MGKALDTIQDVLGRIPRGEVSSSPPPTYAPGVRDRGEDPRVAFVVPSMAKHMTDEGWQIFQGLASAGYNLRGHGLPDSASPLGTDVVAEIKALESHVDRPVSTVVVQDKREWEGKTAGGKDFNPLERLTHIKYLSEFTDRFKATIVKDAQHNLSYHKESADEMGCHAWIVYYHPDIVCHLASYVRRIHAIRTYHTVDPSLVPQFSGNRAGTLISGAISRAYPLRSAILQSLGQKSMRGISALPHPGYHRRGCATPQYLRLLSRYKVSICTASVYGYALRKIIESTACGCVVITNLPTDDNLPHIDGNLIRVPSSISPQEVAMICRKAEEEYDLDKQIEYSKLAKEYYSYKYMGKDLSTGIEIVRRWYNGPPWVDSPQTVIR